MKKRLALAAGLVLLVAAPLGGPVRGTSAADPFTVVIPASILNSAVSDPGHQMQVADLAHFLQSISAYANGSRCTGVVFNQRPANDPNDAILELGLPGQPEACSLAGAKVSLCRAPATN